MMIENIEIYLKYNNSSINEIFQNLKKSGLYCELNFIDIIADNPDSEPYNSFIDSIINTNCFLDSQDKENIKLFLTMMGKSHTEGQIMNCNTYKEIFKRKLDTLEKNETVKCKSSGALILGTCLVILILIV